MGRSLHQIVVTVKSQLVKIPWLGELYRQARSKLGPQQPFVSSAYWEERYRQGANSGLGSYGELAEFKAEIINNFVATNEIQSIIEFGCGDGNQLKLAKYPLYLGFDVSRSAVSTCQSLFADDSTKSFKLMGEYANESAELALSLDVVYHLVEDSIYDTYMHRLFAAAKRFVIIYSSDFEDAIDHSVPHVRHRKFTSWVTDNIVGWSLIRYIPNRYPANKEGTQGASADFYIYATNN